MLRQVAYDTLSRHDRKSRHLKVAAYLAATFPNDGEEVADLIARHYLDALAAVPDDTDAGQIRGRAVAALTRAAERAERTGATALAATSYATAAELTTPSPGAAEAPDGQPSAAALWERAAQAAVTGADLAAAIDYAGKARDQYLRHGEDRAAARVQATAGWGLRQGGRNAEARENLSAALEVLRAESDTDTVDALQQLAALAVSSGSPDADQLSAEALTLGQALGVGVGQLGGLFLARGMYLISAGRRPEAAAHYRESVRLAIQAGDNLALGRTLLNLCDALATTDPAAAAEAGRDSVGHLRRAGARTYLGIATTNRAQALMMLGDWDAAAEELAQAIDSDGLQDIEWVPCCQGLLAALRGDTATAESILASLSQFRASEDLQDQSQLSLTEAAAAAAGHRLEDALRHARRALEPADTIGISSEDQRWAWPLAARAAHDLGDHAAVRDLLAVLDAHQPGYLAPMLRAERDLVRARLAAADDDQVAAAPFAAAMRSLREQGTPYHLAHGLLDYAAHLSRLQDLDGAAAAVGEAREIAARLRCQPLLDRAADLAPASPPVLTDPR